MEGHWFVSRQRLVFFSLSHIGDILDFLQRTFNLTYFFLFHQHNIFMQLDCWDRLTKASEYDAERWLCPP